MEWPAGEDGDGHGRPSDGTCFVRSFVRPAYNDSGYFGIGFPHYAGYLYCAQNARVHRMQALSLCCSAGLLD